MADWYNGWNKHLSSIVLAVMPIYPACLKLSKVQSKPCKHFLFHDTKIKKINKITLKDRIFKVKVISPWLLVLPLSLNKRIDF